MTKELHYTVPKTSRATPATIGKRRVKILSRQVATLADFLSKSKLVSVLCGSHKNFNRQYKIKGRVKNFVNVQRHMSLPRPNESYHFQANLVWWDSPFKGRVTSGKISLKIESMDSPHWDIRCWTFKKSKYLPFNFYKSSNSSVTQSKCFPILSFSGRQVVLTTAISNF